MLSIIIPHYRTEQHIRLCLRSLRKYTKGQLQVIVVDNNSADSSLDYLKSVSWIELIENHTGSIGSLAHKEALDLGMKKTTGDWVSFFHSDTIVLKHGWDTILLNMLQEKQASGLSTVIRDINQYEKNIKKLKNKFKDIRMDFKNYLRRNSSDIKIMSYCFIVKKEVLQNSNFSFTKNMGDVVTEFYYQEIKDKYPFLLVNRSILEPLLWHTSNVTSILTGQMTEKTLIDKFAIKNDGLFKQSDIQEILEDSSLDAADY
jgi:glycosyltransferase involved in cell wall biosynthesis